MSVTFLLLVLKNLKKYHKGDFAGHCPIFSWDKSGIYTCVKVWKDDMA